MNSTTTTLMVVYAAVLGWVAHGWWREEKERIAWRAAEKARAHLQFEADMAARQPAESSGSPAGTT